MAGSKFAVLLFSLLFHVHHKALALRAESRSSVDAIHPRAPATIKTLVCDPGPNNWLATEYSHATVAVDKYYTRLAAANGLDKTLRLGQKPTSKNCESAVCMGDAEIFVCNDNDHPIDVSHRVIWETVRKAVEGCRNGDKLVLQAFTTDNWNVIVRDPDKYICA